MPILQDSLDATKDHPQAGTKNCGHVVQGPFDYERVEASQTAQVLGTTGAAGDILHGLYLEANTGALAIVDGTATILTLAASTTLGFKELNLRAQTAWKITTAASTSCLAIGRFS